MFSTRIKRQRNKRLLNFLIESDTDFMMRQNDHGAQIESITIIKEENITFRNANNPAPVSSSQVDVHTLEENLANEVRNEVDNVMTTVKIRVQDAILTTMESFGNS